MALSLRRWTAQWWLWQWQHWPLERRQWWQQWWQRQRRRRHAQTRAYPRGGSVCEPIATLNRAFELLSLEAVLGIAPKSTGITGSHSTPLPRDGQVSNMILIDQPHMPVHAIPKGGNNTAGFLFLVGQLFICEWCRLLDVWVDCT